LLTLETHLTYTDEHLQERARTLALHDAIQHTRRAAAAMLAARAGEGDEHRLAATFEAHRRLVLVLRDLERLG
jgi:hypothetical protein